MNPLISRATQRALLLLCGVLAPRYSLAAETCRFAGTTDYAGQVTATATAAPAGDATRIDVAVTFDATSPLWLHMHYLVEETSLWRNGKLLDLALNTRYLFAGHVVRQQWDTFDRTPDGLLAHRIEGKRPAEFRGHFPRFADHWDLAAFGLPWLDDYAKAQPDRRPDLDLSHVPPNAAVQSPLALAFYWVRFLHPGAQHAQVFLPGFKADKLADLALTPAGHQWRGQFHHPYLHETPPSTATAQLSPDGHLQHLSFMLHATAGSAGGSLDQTGCQGSPPR